MSQPPRRPSVKPRTAGATPNEIMSASESRSAPSIDWRRGCEARDVAVEHVADERQRQQHERHPQKARVAGGDVVEAQKDRDGAAAALPIVRASAAVYDRSIDSAGAARPWPTRYAGPRRAAPPRVRARLNAMSSAPARGAARRPRTQLHRFRQRNVPRGGAIGSSRRPRVAGAGSSAARWGASRPAVVVGPWAVACAWALATDRWWRPPSPAPWRRSPYHRAARAGLTYAIDHEMPVDSPAFLDSGGRRDRRLRCSTATTSTCSNNGDEFYPAMLDGHPGRAPLDHHRGLHLLARRDRAGVCPGDRRAGDAPASPVKILLDTVGSATIGQRFCRRSRTAAASSRGSTRLAGTRSIASTTAPTASRSSSTASSASPAAPALPITGAATPRTPSTGATCRCGSPAWRGAAADRLRAELAANDRRAGQPVRRSFRRRRTPGDVAVHTVLSSPAAGRVDGADAVLPVDRLGAAHRS